MTMGWALALVVGSAPLHAQNVGVLPAPALDLKAAGFVYAVARAADGKLVIGGYFNEVNGQPRANIARLNADGTLDASWNPGADEGVESLAVDANGDVYAGGYFGTIGGLPRLGVAKLDGATGAAVVGWDVQLDGGVADLSLDGSGQLYVTGNFSNAGSSAHGGLIRVDSATGEVDHAWVPSLDFSATNMAISDDWVYLSGIDAPDTGVLTRFALAGAGTRDPIWLPAPDAEVRDLAIDTTHLYVVGPFNSIGGAARHTLARIALSSAAGSADSTWNPAPDAAVCRVDVDATGVYAAGNFAAIGGQPRRRLARLSLSDAAATPGWSPDAAPFGSACVVLASGDGGAIVAGDIKRVDGALHPGIVKLLPSGAADASFTTRVLRPASVVMTQPLSDGGYLIGGDFLYVGIVARPFLLRLAADRSWDTTWSVDLDATVSFAREVVGSGFPIVIGGAFERVDGMSLSHAARLALDSTPDASWNPQVKSAANTGTVSALHIEGTQLFIGGVFDSVDGQQRGNLAKLDLVSGELEGAWSADTDDTVLSIVGDNAGAIFAGGQFTTIDGVARERLAKVTSAGTGTVDSNWNPVAGSAFVRRLLFDPVAHHVYVAGAFNSLGGNTAIRRLGRVSALGSGAVDAGWIPNPSNGSTRTLLLDPSGWLYFGGLFSTVAGQPISRIARTDVRNVANGAPDPAWRFEITEATAPVVFSIAPVSGGGLLVGGLFDHVDGLSRGSVAALGTQLDPVFRDGFE